MKNNNWACPIIAAVTGSIFAYYGNWIPAFSLLAIGTRGIIQNLMDESVNVSSLLREMRT
jgi:hypothetical protein